MSKAPECAIFYLEVKGLVFPLPSPLTFVLAKPSTEKGKNINIAMTAVPFKIQLQMI